MQAREGAGFSDRRRDRLFEGRVEADQRALNMVAQMDLEGFGACTTTGVCSASCPKDISLINIAKMNREYLRASLMKKDEISGGDSA